MHATQHLLADATTGSHLLAGQRALTGLALGSLSAWRGHLRATALERETGRRPWGWSPVV